MKTHDVNTINLFKYTFNGNYLFFNCKFLGCSCSWSDCKFNNCKLIKVWNESWNSKCSWNPNRIDHINPFLALGFKVISPLLEDVIKAVRIIGAVYLMTLGYLSFTSKNLSDNLEKLNKFDKKYILQGLIVILSNPKAFLFLGAFIPQFIDINKPIGSQIIYFGILFMIVGAIFDGMYAVVFGKFREIIINKYINILNKLGGTLLFFVGLWLLFY